MSFFKPEDFAGHGVLYDKPTHLNAAADRANRILTERGVRVYFNDDKTMSPYWEASSCQNKTHTHQALLVCIEELRCEHSPDGWWAHKATKCLRCGIQLRAKWEPA